VTDVGPLLQHWRKARRLSQLALAATTLGTQRDVTLQELRIECFFPANDATRSQARQLAAAVVGVSEREMR
jgi:hypothetical protein